MILVSQAQASIGIGRRKDNSNGKQQGCGVVQLLPLFFFFLIAFYCCYADREETKSGTLIQPEKFKSYTKDIGSKSQRKCNSVAAKKLQIHEIR